MRVSKRHIVKSLSWRLIGTIDTFIVAWLITGDLYEGLNLSVITTFTKLFWYYLHELYWVNSSIVNYNKLHIIKTFSWRAIGTLDTFFFSFILTGNPLTSAKIGGIETISKMLLYFFHEKIWHKINFGLDKRNKGKHLKAFREKR